MAHTLLVRDADQLRDATPAEILDRARTLIAQRFCRGATVLASPELTLAYLRLEIAALRYQVFGVLLLDARRRLIRSEILFRGTIDACSVHPREVARVVVEADAAAVVLFRNDPSGVAEVREADGSLARGLAQALRLIDVRVLDYLIVAAEGEHSFAEAGRL
jgi:DNA repair protein RadC